MREVYTRPTSASVFLVIILMHGGIEYFLYFICFLYRTFKGPPFNQFHDKFVVATKSRTTFCRSRSNKIVKINDFGFGKINFTYNL